MSSPHALYGIKKSVEERIKNANGHELNKLVEAHYHLQAAERALRACSADNQPSHGQHRKYREKKKDESIEDLVSTLDGILNANV